MTMSGDNSIANIGGGAGAIGAGAAVLPHTGGSWLMTAVSILMIVCGMAIITAFVITKIAKKRA